MSLKQTIKNLLPGWDGRLAAHHVGYLGDLKVHRAVPYTATNPMTVAKKLSLMQSEEIDIVLTTWQGAYAASCHLDAQLTVAECQKIGMQFGLLLDPWSAKLNSKGVEDNNNTANVTSSLKAASTQAILNNPAYMPEKYILDFNTGADLTTLAATFPSYNFLQQNVGFSWISIPNISDSPLRNAAAVANLKSQHANPKMKIASFCESFDDSGQPLPVGVPTQAAFDAAGGKRDPTKSVWGGNARILESFAGQFMEQNILTISPSIAIIALLTWDDYDEQSSGPYEKTVAERLGMVW